PMNHHAIIARTTRLTTICVLALLAQPVARLHAFTGTDADNIFNSFNNSFYVSSGGQGYYKMDTTGGRADFWRQAEEIEMIIDAYERTSSTVYKGMITETINGFTANFGSDWSWNNFNDDLMWSCIAYLRGYQKTGT